MVIMVLLEPAVKFNCTKFWNKHFKHQKVRSHQAWFLWPNLRGLPHQISFKDHKPNWFKFSIQIEGNSLGYSAKTKYNKSVKLLVKHQQISKTLGSALSLSLSLSLWSSNCMHHCKPLHFLEHGILPCPFPRWKTHQQKGPMQILRHGWFLALKHWWKEKYMVSCPLTSEQTVPDALESKERRGNMIYQCQNPSRVLHTFNFTKGK